MPNSAMNFETDTKNSHIREISEAEITRPQIYNREIEDVTASVVELYPLLHLYNVGTSKLLKNWLKTYPEYKFTFKQFSSDFNYVLFEEQATVTYQTAYTLLPTHPTLFKTFLENYPLVCQFLHDTLYQKLAKFKEMQTQLHAFQKRCSEITDAEVHEALNQIAVFQKEHPQSCGVKTNQTYSDTLKKIFPKIAALETLLTINIDSSKQELFAAWLQKGKGQKYLLQAENFSDLFKIFLKAANAEKKYLLALHYLKIGDQTKLKNFLQLHPDIFKFLKTKLTKESLFIAKMQNEFVAFLDEIKKDKHTIVRLLSDELPSNVPLFPELENKTLLRNAKLVIFFNDHPEIPLKDAQAIAKKLLTKDDPSYKFVFS